MDAKFPSLSRRQFLLMGGGATLSTLLGGAYLASGCPLSDSGVCVGPCTAYVDFNRDGICDRVQDRPLSIPGSAIAGQNVGARGDNAACVACPFGITNDPFPGKCRHYVDTDGNGICDLSEENSCADETLARPAPNSVPPDSGDESPCVACPLGLVDDPFPGECRHYTDNNGNGICDLSEPDSCTNDTLETTTHGRGKGQQGGGQKRRGQRKDGQ